MGALHRNDCKQITTMEQDSTQHVLSANRGSLLRYRQPGVEGHTQPGTLLPGNDLVGHLFGPLEYSRFQHD